MGFRNSEFGLKLGRAPMLGEHQELKNWTFQKVTSAAKRVKTFGALTFSVIVRSRICFRRFKL